jgi:teichoic acid transport system permease protein
MSEKGRLSAPGGLAGPGSLAGGTDTLDGEAQQLSQAAAGSAMLPEEPLAEYARKNGLTLSAARPSPLGYLKLLWSRRHFIVAFATARNVGMYTDAKLGQLWQVLTPLLNAAVYYLIFGIILGTNRGVPNFVAFLVTGIFIFNFTQRSFITTSRVIPDSLPLIRALHFPRAALPLGYVLIELQQLFLAMLVLAAIVLGTGEPLTWYWLLVIPAMALQAIFNAGTGLILARLGAGAEDFSQLLPFIVRAWMYASGVMFSITALTLSPSGTLHNHPTISRLLQLNPAAVYINLVRNALLTTQRLSTPGAKPYNKQECAVYLAHSASKSVSVLEHSAYCHASVTFSQESMWLWGVGWAVVAAVIGFFVFWQAEARYGRG